MNRRLLPGFAVFVEVAESLSFSQAAHRLGVNASSISRTVSRLESELGVKLFRRTSRAVSLTQEGVVLFERCRDAFAQIDEARDLLQGMQETVQGVLRVTIPLGIGRKYLLPALPTWLRRYPKLRLEVLTTDRTVDVVYENIDVAVRVGTLTPSSLRLTRIRASRFACIASPDYLSHHPTPHRPDDLHTHACVAFRLPTGVLRAWPMAGPDGGRTLTPPAVLVLDDGIAIVDAVAAGVGIGYVPDYLAEAELRAGRVVPLLTEYSAPAGDVHCVYTERRESTLRVRAFIDFVRRTLTAA